METSAIWNATLERDSGTRRSARGSLPSRRAWQSAFAPILISFSCSVDLYRGSEELVARVGLFDPLEGCGPVYPP